MLNFASDALTIFATKGQMAYDFCVVNFTTEINTRSGLDPVRAGLLCSCLAVVMSSGFRPWTASWMHVNRFERVFVAAGGFSGVLKQVAALGLEVTRSRKNIER